MTLIPSFGTDGETLPGGTPDSGLPWGHPSVSRKHERARRGPDLLVAAAAAGATIMAIASWSIAAVSVRWSSAHEISAYVAFYVGLTLASIAWLMLGRRLLAGDEAVTPRVLRRFVMCAASPFLLAAPLGRDLWAYAAQGHLTGLGLDPYTHGPNDAPGVFADEVGRRWMDSPAPYGPLWLRISQFAAWASHDHPIVAASLLRLPGFAGLLLCCWALPVFAERLGGRLTPALWLGLASPLMFVLGVGGGHNDLLMLGAALAGLALACRPGLTALAVGAAVAGVAIMVKSPAAIVVAFTVPVWLHANREPRTPRRIITACAAAIAGSGVAVTVVTVATGLGFGWARQVNSDARWVSWLSVPSAAAMLGKTVTGAGHIRTLDETLRACRTVGEALAVLLLVGLWLLALRPMPNRDRARPAGYLAAALGAAALLGPSVQPWYYLWGLALAGLVVVRRSAVIGLAAAGLMFPVMITPSGFGWESDWRAPVVIVGSLAITAALLRRARSTDDDDDDDDDGTDHARTGTCGDDGTPRGHG